MALSPRRFWQPTLLGLCVLSGAACSSTPSESGTPTGTAGQATGTAGTTSTASGGGGASSSAGTSGSIGAAGSSTVTAGTGGTLSGTGGASAGGAGGAVPAGGTGGYTADTFWDPSNIPAAKNVMIFKFLNRSNGKYTDAQMFWSFKNDSIGVNETHSFAEEPFYDMPANGSGRMYFYLEEPNGKYYDFIEFTIGGTPPVFNGNTTRVDAFGLKIAMRMHCADNFDVSVGENLATFQEDRAVTFQKYLAEVPAEFQGSGSSQMPYRIVEPGAAGFDANGMYQNYYDSWADQLWAANGITVPKPGPNGNGIDSPDLSAALYRHVGGVAGTFDSQGKLLNKSLWADSTTFYTTAPADYYAKFWHERAINGKAYGFPYDDVGGYSSYISHGSPQYLEVAVGW